MNDQSGSSSHRASPPARTGLRGSPTLRFLLAVVLPLFAAMAIAKAFAAGSWEWGSVRFPIKLAIISWHDMLFAAGWMGIGLPPPPQDCQKYRQRLSAWANFERTHLKTLID